MPTIANTRDGFSEGGVLSRRRVVLQADAEVVARNGCQFCLDTPRTPDELTWVRTRLRSSGVCRTIASFPLGGSLETMVREGDCKLGGETA